jgi:hypothetical protein
VPGAGVLEVGATSEATEGWSLELRAVRAPGMDGGHPSTQGIDTDGGTVEVPLYRHEVGLDLLRIELIARRRLSEDWTAWLRVPYDVKERSASVGLVEEATPEQAEQMERSMQIHHPAATLSGFADASLLAARRARGVLADGDTLLLAAGTTVPLGRTEHDPFELGEEGLAHEHVQFGTGTFDPLLEAYYSRPLGGAWELAAYATARLPLYENDKAYFPPLQLSAGGLVSRRLSERLGAHLGVGAFRQEGARWDGILDRDGGFEALELTAGASWSVGASARLTLGLIVPLSERSLVDAAERFERGTAVTLGISVGIGRPDDR